MIKIPFIYGILIFRIGIGINLSQAGYLLPQLCDLFVQLTERPFTAPLHRLFPAQSLTGQVFFSPPDFTTVLFLLYFGCMDALIPLFLFVPETVYLLFQFPALLEIGFP